jgi:hypothetical protein|tara:strand:- start:54 stop:236 length:183 start_codon:yes stop_codon:yes gene_type:complete
MPFTPAMGFSEADFYLSIEDPLIRETAQQLSDNIRVLRKEIITLKKKVSALENEKDTDLL